MKKALLFLSVLSAVFMMPGKVQAQVNQTVMNGAATAPVTFPGAGCAYKWVNNNPSIGLAMSGSGDISSFVAVNNSTTPVTATITATPQAAGYAYIANGGDGTISVINTATNTVESVFAAPVGANAVGNMFDAIALNGDGTSLYLANDAASPVNSISVINTSTNSITSTTDVVAVPSAIIFSPDGKVIYVACTGSIFHGVLYVFNASDNTLIKQVNLSFSPYNLAVSPDGTRLYSTDTPFGNVKILDATTYTELASLRYVNYPEDIAVSPDGQSFYVSDQQTNAVLVINAVTFAVTANIPVGQYPNKIAVNQDGSRMYVVNVTSGTVSVIDVPTNQVVATIPVGSDPLGIAFNPDESLLYVVSRTSNNVSVISTATNTVKATVPVGAFPVSFGNFVSAGIGCSSKPVTFTITVNPTPVSIITATTAIGSISACAGNASTSPDIAQFTISGSNLSGDITAAAPPGFEISTNADNGYTNSITLPQSAATVNSTLIYVRSAPSAVGSISGNVVLSASGAATQNVAVSGVVTPLPLVNAVANQTVMNGTATTTVNFTGTANSYSWVNDAPGIGIPASGTGDIASFNALNTGSSPVTATINVVPVGSAGPGGAVGCTGISTQFTFTVTPTPPPTIDFDASTFSALSTIYGTQSASVSFTVSAMNLRAGIVITPPPGFEVSLNNNQFSSTVTVGAAGTLPTTTVYIRLTSTTPVGIYDGNINLSSAQAYDTNFGIDQSIVNRAPLTIIADNINKMYGTALYDQTGSTAFTSTGLQNSETIGSVNITYGSGSAATDAAGTYTQSVLAALASGGTFMQSNYTINYLSGDIIVGPAPLLVIADDKTKIYGTVNPQLTVTFHGFQNNDGAAQLTTQPLITTTAVTNSPVGGYTITASGGISADYSFNYVPGTLTITPSAELVVIPNAFTPNGDGINDTWNIKYINTFLNSLIDVYNRYGVKVYASVGYGIPWNGTYNGVPLPAGTYYYLINLKNGGKILSGFVTLIR